MAKAYAYVRFSSKQQEEGNSTARQLAAAEKYAEEHGLDLDSNTYHDKGVSAFKGLNLEEGRLGVFLNAVESGKIPRGSYLLIESFDRISRNVISEAQALLLRILNLDINVVTLLDKQVFTKQKYNEDGGISVMLSLLTMLRAHEESKTKSTRVAKAWDALRKGEVNKAGDKPRKIITKMAPAWLTAVDDEWVVIEERAETIRRIFDLAAAGNGSPSSARILNEEKRPTFSDRSTEWSSGTVAHIIGNKAVAGIYETDKIPAREGYFPEIVPRAQFEQVQRAARARNFAPIRNTEGGVINLFAGRSFCGLCGSKMKTVSKSGSSAYVHCFNAYSNKGCPARRVAYTVFEESFLTWLMRKDVNVFREEVQVADDPRTQLQFELQEAEQKLAKIEDLLIDLPKSASLIQRYKNAEIEIEGLQERLRKALPASKNPSSSELDRIYENYAYYESLRDMLDSGVCFYGRYADHAMLVEDSLKTDWTEPQKEKMLLNLRRHERFVQDFGAKGYKLSEATLQARRVKFNALRKEMQVMLRHLIKKMELHHLPALEERPEGATGKKIATYESYRATFVNGEIFGRWYERPGKGFQKGNKNGKR